MLAWWGTFAARGTGGREVHVLSVGCVLVAVAFLVVRPWRTLPLWALILGQSIGLAAFAVVVWSPSGTAGLDDAASYTLAAERALVLIAWARSPARRTLLVVAVLLAGSYQFVGGWLAWWGHQDPATLFQGTYYWHNQAGIALAAGALAGAVLVARPGRDPLRFLGWFLTPLCVAGTMYTGSRGSQLGLLLGFVILVGLGLARSGHRAAGLRVVVLSVSRGVSARSSRARPSSPSEPEPRPPPQPGARRSSATVSSGSRTGGAPGRSSSTGRSPGRGSTPTAAPRRSSPSVGTTTTRPSPTTASSRC